MATGAGWLLVWKKTKREEEKEHGMRQTSETNIPLSLGWERQQNGLQMPEEWHINSPQKRHLNKINEVWLKLFYKFSHLYEEVPYNSFGMCSCSQYYCEAKSPNSQVWRRVREDGTLLAQHIFFSFISRAQNVYTFTVRRSCLDGLLVFVWLFRILLTSTLLHHGHSIDTKNICIYYNWNIIPFVKFISSANLCTIAIVHWPARFSRYAVSCSAAQRRHRAPQQIYTQWWEKYVENFSRKWKYTANNNKSHKMTMLYYTYRYLSGETHRNRLTAD